MVSSENFTIEKDQLEGIIIGIDIDAVCADHNEEFKKYVAEYLNIDASELGDVQDWDYASWGLDRETFLHIHPDAVRRGMFRDMKPMPRVAETIKSLTKAGAKIRIITHRLYINDNHQEAVKQTAEWLDLNNIPYHDLCMIEQKSHVNADIYIDDSPFNVNVLREQTGKPVIVFDQLYNRDIPGPRASSWSEIPEIIVNETGRVHHGRQQQFDFDEEDPLEKLSSKNGSSFLDGKKASFCDAITITGAPCRRQVVGGGRCHDHRLPQKNSGLKSKQ